MDGAKPVKKPAAKKAAKPVAQVKTTATSLVLRCCAPDMSSHSGFIWPGVGGIATAPDWKDNTECGNGLHGWLYGQGDHSVSDHWNNADATWLVVEVAQAYIRMLGGKCKFPSGKVVFVGGKSEAADYIIEHEPQAKNCAVIGRFAKVGDREVASVGALGTATAGNSGTATAGNSGTATAGDSGTATAGYKGTATAGNSGTATAGNSGTATAGEKGELRIEWWDKKSERYRTKQAYVGEDGIEANTAYKLNDKQEFVKVTK